MCFYKKKVHFQLLIKLLAYRVQNWRPPNIVHSQSVANWVSWPRLYEWRLRGVWTVPGQCLWVVVDCASDHADWWLLTTSDRWSREQCCWHASSLPVLSQSQEDVRSHRLCHAAHVAHRQIPLSTVKLLRSQFHSRHPTTPPAQHPHQQPLKHHRFQHYECITSVGSVTCLQAWATFCLTLCGGYQVTEMDKREVRAVVILKKVLPFKGNDTKRHCWW